MQVVRVWNTRSSARSNLTAKWLVTATDVRDRSVSAVVPSFASLCLKIVAASTSLLTAWLLASCSQDNRYVAPPRVTVAVPLQQPVTRYLEATGNTAAVNSADLVAGVSGFIQKINYRDGALVKKGALPFTIEPEPYRVNSSRRRPPRTGPVRR
jgi:hypothetical protein